MKKVICFIFSVVSLATFACGGDEEDAIINNSETGGHSESDTISVAVTDVTLNMTSIELERGETITLTASVNPFGANPQTIVWTSSNDDVAMVDDGIVTALKAGTTIISAKVGSCSAECSVTVVKNGIVYLVKFDTDGGSWEAEQSVARGMCVYKPNNPRKDCYTFQGWYIDDAEFDFNKPITQNVIIKAKWDNYQPVAILGDNFKYIAKPFSVSETKQVYFSVGNLQYNCANKVWQFADHQFDYIGSDNANISDTYNGYIDLFGWGTWLDMACPTKAFMSLNYYDYSWSSRKTAIGAEWETLSDTEWQYILNKRINADQLWKLSTVNNVYGLIILPDGSCTTIADTYNSKEWNDLEAVGAVFLPAAGQRLGTNLSNVGVDGLYWTSTEFSSDSAIYFCLYTELEWLYSGFHSGFRCRGGSVRLVRPL